jgi:TMEM175 potassium channel family protein
MLRRIVSVDHTILLLNLLPFSTALMAQYLTAAHGQNLAAVVWGGSFLVMSLAFFVMQCHLLLAKQHLLQQHLTPEVRRTVLRRNAVGPLPYAIATLAAILTPYLTLAVCAFVAVFYALPSTTSDVYQQIGSQEVERGPDGA